MPLDPSPSFKNEEAFVRLDICVQKLHENKKRWFQMEPKERLSYLKNMLCRIQNVKHKDWGAASAHQQGYDPQTLLGRRVAGAEQMINASILANTVRSLIRSYRSLAKKGSLPTVSYSQRDDGRRIYSVFPFDWADRMNYLGIAGVKGEVWTQEPEQESPLEKK